MTPHGRLPRRCEDPAATQEAAAARRYGAAGATGRSATCTTEP